MPIITCEKAPRIYMGRITGPTGEEPGSGKYVMTHGGASIRKQLEGVSAQLSRYKLSPEQSVYSDADGAVAALRDDVLKGVKIGDLEGIIERVMDTRPFLSAETEREYPRKHRNSYDFRFDANYLAPDEPPTAGLIMTQQRRKAFDASCQGFYFTISQVMESYLLAAALMRSAPFNLPVYPATAVISADAEDEEHAPILALVDPAGPLITFNLYRNHPLVGSVEIISDEAMWGVSNTLRAANRVKYLVAEMSMAMMKGEEYPLEDMKQRLREIASALHLCHKIWPGCHFITEAFAFLEESVKAPLAEDTFRSISADWEGFVERFPRMVGSPDMLQAHVMAITAETAESVAAQARMYLSDLIALEDAPAPPDRTLN